MRVRLEIDAQSRHDLGRRQRSGARRRDACSARAWAATAPSPRAGEKRDGSAWPAFEERSFEAFRSYYEYLPRGKHVIEYTVRLNNAGPVRPAADAGRGDVRAGEFGELPNAALEVAP